MSDPNRPDEPESPGAGASPDTGDEDLTQPLDQPGDEPTTMMPPAEGPPPVPPEGPGEDEQPPEGGGGRGGRIALVVALVAVVAALVVAAVLLLGDDDDETADDDQSLVAVPAGALGPDAYLSVDLSQSVDPGQVQQRAPEGPCRNSRPDTDPAADCTIDGTEPGLYGGVRDQSSCQVGDLVNLLGQSPVEQQESWAQALGFPTADLATSIQGLTPVVLLRDTRVTLHGYANGATVTDQAVLERGTAVLAEDNGEPAVRCSGGSPLTAPVAASGAVTYEGDQWNDFAPDRIWAVTGGSTMDRFSLVDLATGDPFFRPVGTDGGDDEDVTPTTTTTTSTTTSTTTTSTTEPTTTTTQATTTTTTPASTTTGTDGE